MNPKPLGVSRAASDAQPASGVSENLLRMVFDCAPVGVAVLEVGDGRLGKVLAANQELCKLLGYDHDDVIGRAARASSSRASAPPPRPRSSR